MDFINNIISIDKLKLLFNKYLIYKYDKKIFQ